MTGEEGSFILRFLCPVRDEEMCYPNVIVGLRELKNLSTYNELSRVEAAAFFYPSIEAGGELQVDEQPLSFTAGAGESKGSSELSDGAGESKGSSELTAGVGESKGSSEFTAGVSDSKGSSVSISTWCAQHGNLQWAPLLERIGDTMEDVRYANWEDLLASGLKPGTARRVLQLLC
jgi:hypothetical protein